MVKHLQSYLPNEEDVRNVLQYHQSQLVKIIHSQMQVHYEEKAADYEARDQGVHDAEPRQLFNPCG